jgi:hypothetical protein
MEGFSSFLLEGFYGSETSESVLKVTFTKNILCTRSHAETLYVGEMYCLKYCVYKDSIAMSNAEKTTISTDRQGEDKSSGGMGQSWSHTHLYLCYSSN